MKRLAIVAGILAALAFTPAPSASAGTQGGISITFYFDGFDALATAQAFTPAIVETPGSDVTSTCSSEAANGDAQFATVTVNCSNLSPLTHTIGATGIGNYALLGGGCRVNEQGNSVTFDGPTFTWTEFAVDGHCSIYLASPVLHVDVVVVGGTATPDDFTVEVFATDGAAVPATTLTDPGDGDCFDSQTFTVGNCDRTELSAGDYFLGVTPVAGYVPTKDCQAETLDREQLPGSTGQFSHGSLKIKSSVDTFCRLTMTYTTQTVSADIVVTNDDGGTAAASAFTIEVFDASNMLVDSGVDPEPGIGNASFVSKPLPVGSYTFGVSGPAGYAYTAAVSVVPVAVATDRLADPSAAFTISPTQSAAAVITANDPTLLATTTVAATPTSTIDPNAVLPATGTASSTLLMWALAAFGLGCGTVVLTRRP
jgi:hypothetical protein